MKKTLKTILLGLVVSCAFVFNVEAATIKEETNDYNQPMFILGSTRFESTEVLSADAVLAAGFNHAKVKAALGEDITKLDYTPKAYYYDPDFDDWYEIEGSNTTLLNETKAEEIENNLDIYYVNNEMKKIEVEYSGDVDQVLTEGVTYDGTKFTVPALTPIFNFTVNGEHVEVAVNKNLEVVNDKAVIEVNGVYFLEQNIEAAILASSEEHPAVLLKDLKLETAIVLDEENVNMVLDLGGFTLSSDETNNPKRVLTTSGANSTLTIKNGNIVAKGAQLIAVGKKELASERVTLNIENDVTIDGYWYGVFTIGDTAVVNLKGTINIAEDGYAISGNGTKNVGYDGTEINILDGAVINAEKGHALYLAQAGTANINGGTLTANTVIGIKSGKLNITGGKLIATGESQVPKINNNGIDSTGDVIYAEVNDSYAKNIEINITGGILTSTNGNIIQEFKSGSTEDIKVTGLYATKNIIDTTLATYTATTESAVLVNGVNYGESGIVNAILASSKEHPAVLQKDLKVDKDIVLDEENANMVLDLGGFTLSATDDCYDVLKTTGAFSTLTVQNGKISLSGSQAVVVGKKELENETVTLNIENDVTISGATYAIYTVGDTAVLNLKGTVNISGDGHAISGNGTKGVGFDGTEINILDGAVINAENGFALYLAQAGTANISGGTLTANTVIGIKSGKLNITGGKLIATGESQVPKINNNGIDSTGDVIYAEVNDSYAKNIEIDITAGTLESANGNIIREFKSNSTDDITVTGDYITNNTTKSVESSTMTVYMAKAA